MPPPMHGPMAQHLKPPRNNNNDLGWTKMQSNYNTYSYSDLVHELGLVFRSVYFRRARFKHLLYLSYLSSLPGIVEYAEQNNIDAKEHIRGIRDILLTCDGTHRIR